MKKKTLIFYVIVMSLSAIAMNSHAAPGDSVLGTVNRDLKANAKQGVPELDCVIEPSEVVDVGSAVPGVVGAITVDRSDVINKGDVIVKIESNVEQAAVALAKARSELNAAIHLREEAAALGQLTQQRNQSLLKKSAISKQEMDQITTETRVAEFQVQQEKDNQRIAALEYQRAKAVLQQRTLTSPVKGVVMDRFKSVGEYINDEPIVRVAQLDPLHVEVIVPVDYWGLVKPGMKASVTAVSNSDAYVATVERVDRVADTASGTYGVRLSLSNPEYAIPAGMRCRLSFLLPEGVLPKRVVGAVDTAPVISREQNE